MSSRASYLEEPGREGASLAGEGAELLTRVAADKDTLKAGAR